MNITRTDNRLLADGREIVPHTYVSATGLLCLMFALQVSLDGRRWTRLRSQKKVDALESFLRAESR